MALGNGRILEVVQMPNTHRFKPSKLWIATRCGFCGEFIWGIKRQSQVCLGCNTPAHPYCTSLASQTPCAPGKIEVKKFPDVFDYRDHWWQSCITLSTCKCCGHAIIKGGYRCRYCRVKIHQPCSLQMLACDMKPCWPDVPQGSGPLQQLGCCRVAYGWANAKGGKMGSLASKSDSAIDSTVVIPSGHPAANGNMAQPQNLHQNGEEAAGGHGARRHNKTSFDMAYVKVEPLGAGAFGSVYLCVDIDTNVKYAVKEIVKSSFVFQPQTLAKMKNEGRVHLAVKHPHIIQAIDIFETPSLIQIVMEKADFDLATHMPAYGRPNYRRPAEAEVRYFFWQVLLAVQYLHHSHITHRDLKMENILLVKKEMTGMQCVLIAKLADFGLAKWLDETGVAATFAGTAMYMAPEIEKRADPYNEIVDMWSMGVILYRMITGRMLRNPLQAGLDIAGLKAEGLVSDCVLDLLQHLLVVNPKWRWSVDQAMAHDWFGQCPALITEFPPMVPRSMRSQARVVDSA